MIRRLLLLVVFFSALETLPAQTNDFGSWMTLSINKKIIHHLEFNFDQEFRLKDNLTQVNLFYDNLGFSYKFSKYFHAAATYRFVAKNKSEAGAWGFRNRIMTDLAFKVKPGNFSIGYRARFQSEWRTLGYSDKYASVPEIYMRNLFKVSYKIGDHFEPYAGAELRWQFRNPRIPYYDGFDRSRFFAGTDYEVNKVQTAGVYFLYQHEWNVIDPQQLYIIGLEYSFSFD